MGGKAGIILVASLSFILGYIGFNLNRYATDAVGNMASYYDASASHNLALAGANVGLAKFYEDTTWLSGSISQTFNEASLKGSFTATMDDLGSYRLRLRSVSNYRTWYSQDLHDTVEVFFNTRRENSFAIFAWMTDFEGNVFWITGDTVWGRVHSNGNLHVNGKPVFMEKATTAKQFDPKAGVGSNKAIYKKGYETGIASIPFPNDLSEIVAASLSGGRNYPATIWVSLSPGTSATGDGMAYIRATEAGPVLDSVSLSDPSFNGVILGTTTVNVQGTLDGRLTIASLSNVVIQNDVLYEQNPLAGSSDDLLGLVADQNVVVANNTANNNNCQIQAAMFARAESFIAEDYNSRGPAGTLQVLGSIVQKERGAVGQFSGSTLTSGFSKRYRYDQRLEDPAYRPPFFPGFYVSTYAITNWWESYRISEVQ
jgi:hypothetical protein